MYVSVFFFFNDTATTEIYTLSLHDALPICLLSVGGKGAGSGGGACGAVERVLAAAPLGLGGGGRGQGLRFLALQQRPHAGHIGLPAWVGPHGGGAAGARPQGRIRPPGGGRGSG